jgi:hypothetical protein
MIHVVKKGHHYFKPHHNKITFEKTIFKRVVFEYDCKYDLSDDDQLDINKLFGVGFFPHHHRNSIRYGWRWNNDRHVIELFAYVYDRGKRKAQYILDLKIGVQYTLCLFINTENCLFVIQDQRGWTIRTLLIKHTIPIMLLGYTLHPYFGGNKTAPHSMTINITNA